MISSPDGPPLEAPWTLGRKHPNNFDFLRFAFAILVLYSHSFGVLPNPRLARYDAFYLLTRGQYNGGWVAVNAFFALSGFLVLHSWLSDSSFWQFLRKRVLRIYPGFLFHVLVSLIVLAPLAQPAGFAYLVSLNYGDLLYNSARFLFPLPGTFPGFMNPNGYDFNPSLWTIPFEFSCYLIVALLGLLRAYRARVGVLLLYALTLLLMLHTRQETQNWPRLLNSYAAGMAFYLYRDVIPRKPWILALCLAALFATALRGQGGQLALNTCGVYALMYAAFTPSPRLSRFAKYGDFSYGIYLYGFPLCRLMVYWFGAHLTIWTLFLTVLASTIALAWLSWILVEKPFLEFKTREESRVAPSRTASETSSQAASRATTAAPLSTARPSGTERGTRDRNKTPFSQASLDLLRAALVGSIALIALMGWADVYLLRLFDHAAGRLLHHPLPSVAEGALLLALTAWLGWGIAALYATIGRGKRGRGEPLSEVRPLRPAYVVAVAPVYWSIGLLIVRLLHDLASTFLRIIHSLHL